MTVFILQRNWTKVAFKESLFTRRPLFAMPPGWSLAACWTHN